MKCLDIALIGNSQALDAIGEELAQHGHRLHYAASDCDLLIEDGSQALDSPIIARDSLHLRLQEATHAGEWLPRLTLLCWHGSARTKRLLDQLPLAPENSGNGQMLHRRAVDTLVDYVALLVSRVSREAEYLQHTTALDTDHALEGASLLRLQALAYLHRFNDTARPDLLCQAQTPLIEQLDRSLQRFGQRTALVIAGTHLSYGQLRAQSMAIQQRLLPLLAPLRGGGQPLVVGLCLEKSAPLYAAILAILGSDAVYLPLEPDHPLPRQQYILQNAGAVLLLHDGQHPLAQQMPGLDVARIDARSADLHQPLLHSRPSADAPCMAFYTSGTTGQPKGVVLSQHNLSHFCAWYADFCELNEQSRVLQFASLGFDASLIDIFPALIQGAALIVPSDSQRRDPLQLAALLREQRLTHGFLPPALLSLLPGDEPLGLDWLMTGGDVCEPEAIERLTPHTRLCNLYGPTEATVLATARPMRSGDHNRLLGAPIANSRVLILDDAQQPVAEQQVGELYIVGPGVALGYLHNPQQTAERYLELPLPDGQRLRAYRSGDLGKWTEAGIELCGRRDNQVKIRGFRVEPEEIEHCLRASRLFGQVAVVIDSQRRILAFVAQPAGEQPELAPQRLKQWAAQHLPDYMQPLACTLLASLPCASNGKVDRQALLRLPVTVVANTSRQLPRSADEERLRALWAELLELPAEEICTQESFFNLGGHSILLSRLLLGLREQFGRSISINRFIEDPTLARLATLVRGNAIEQNLCEQALADACRPLDIEALASSRMGDVGKVIVTGANSFVGVHIVQALLAAGAREVACLVRDSAGQSAAQRFAQSLRDNCLEHLDLSRVQVHAADLTRPDLGLAPPLYERLDREFGALVHNAANVNHVLDYPSLAGDNVEPLLHLLRLCEGRSKKIFNFISTLSACSTRDAAGQVLEVAAAPTPPIYLRNGYNLSKWVGERLLERARERGVQVNLYRPGNISFNSRNGVCQPHKNRLLLMLKGSLQLGLVPRLELNFDLMPVDFLARFVAWHSSRYQPARSVFNLHNPQPLSWAAYVAAFEQLGQRFEWTTVAEWQQQLARVDSQNALFGVLGFYLNGFEEDIGDISMIGHANAHDGVRQMGEHYPEKSPALLRKGCEYLKQIAFI